MTDIGISTPYPRATSPADAGEAGQMEDIRREDRLSHGLDHAEQNGLNWREQQTFQRETTALLDQMGVAGLGWRRGR